MSETSTHAACCPPLNANAPIARAVHTDQSADGGSDLAIRFADGINAVFDLADTLRTPQAGQSLSDFERGYHAGLDLAVRALARVVAEPSPHPHHQTGTSMTINTTNTTTDPGLPAIGEPEWCTRCSIDDDNSEPGMGRQIVEAFHDEDSTKDHFGNGNEIIVLGLDCGHAVELPLTRRYTHSA